MVELLGDERVDAIREPVAAAAVATIAAEADLSGASSA